MLEPQKRRQLQDALISAYPTHNKLKQFSLYRLNQNIETIANCSGDLSEVAFNLIEWAVANGEIEKLISAAWNDKPANPDLKAFVEKVGMPSQLQQELVVPLHQQPEAQMLVEIQTPIEKPIEPQSETVDINTKKYFSPQMEKPQPMPPISPSVDLPPKSLATALASARVYYKEIKQKQIQLLPVYLLFGLDIIEEIPPEQYESVTISPLFDIEDIWPEHCKLAIIPLRDIAQPVHEFYDLINGALTRERTTEVVQLQSSLTIPLRCSYELLRNLLSLISEFQEVCQTSLGDMIEERREIMDNLKELRKALDRVNTTMNSYPH